MATSAPPPSQPYQETVLGIDLGTTFSVVAIWDWKTSKVELLTNDHGKRTTPSIVSYGNTELYMGEAARQRMISNPANTIFHAKRMIGLTYDQVFDSLGETQFPFKIIEAENGEVNYQVTHQDALCDVSPKDVSGLVLYKLKENAEKRLGHPVSKAVITVPAYFSEPQKRATKEAGEKAGFEVLGLLAEPCAAALAYGIDRRGMSQAKREKMEVDGWYILVFDLGGGTLDVSVVKLDGRGKFVVKAVTGDFHLGGLDFDQVLLQHFLALVRRDHPELQLNERSLARLRAKCEEVKRMLSASEETILDIELQGIDLTYEITRREFESLGSELFTAVMQEVDSALEEARLAPADIDDVVLVGGSSRIPYIQQLLRGIFPRKNLCTTINPDEAIAIGAAVQAAALYRNQEMQHQQPPPGAGHGKRPPPPPSHAHAGAKQPPPSTVGGGATPQGKGAAPLPSGSDKATPAPIPRGLPSQHAPPPPAYSPSSASSNASPAGLPPHTYPEPHAPTFQQGEAGPGFSIDNIVVTNVTPLTLGIALSDGTLDVLIPRGTPMPATKKDLYTTSNDSQRNVVIQVFEGENKRVAKDNALLGKFSLDVPPLKEQGKWPEIEVTFTVTGEGLFNVSAQDVAHGQKTSINIERPTSSSK